MSPRLPEFDCRLTVRVPYETREGLEAIAAAYGGTISDTLRLAAEALISATHDDDAFRHDTTTARSATS